VDERINKESWPELKPSKPHFQIMNKIS
jgi:hypothetical protein